MNLRLLFPILAGVTIRMAVVALFPNMDLHGDEMIFTQGAVDLLETGETSYFPFRPPLYIWYAAAVFKVAGYSPDALRYSQAILEGLNILGIGLLVHRTIGPKAAPWAAWAYALFPDYIAYSHYLWSETVMLVTLVYGLLALVHFREQPTLLRALVVGLVWGVSDLVKPYHLYMLPILLAWLLWSVARENRIAALKGSALAVLTAFLVIAPWSIHVSKKEGRPVLISTTGKLNLRTGVNILPPPQTDLGNAWKTSRKQRNNPKFRRDEGLVEFILGNPLLYAERTITKWSYLWSPNSFMLRLIYKGDLKGKQPKYGLPADMHPVLRLGAVYSMMAANAVATIALVFGIFAARDPVVRGLAVTYCGTYCAMITLTPALSRYRLPMMIFAVIYVGAFLSRQVQIRDLRDRPWALAGSITLALGLFGLWFMRLPDIFAAIW